MWFCTSSIQVLSTIGLQRIEEVDDLHYYVLEKQTLYTSRPNDLHFLISWYYVQTFKAHQRVVKFYARYQAGLFYR